jgi:hypothetical protein
MVMMVMVMAMGQRIHQHDARAVEMRLSIGFWLQWWPILPTIHHKGHEGPLRKNLLPQSFAIMNFTR